MDKAIIIGAGPAGLTAALELLRHTAIRPIILESADQCAGLARSYPLGSGFIDVGGHRFHSADKRIQDFWLSVMPVGEQGFRRKRRHSQLLFKEKYFRYPVNLSLDSLHKLGWMNACKAGLSFVRTKKKEVRTLEDFFSNTYGKELFALFFEKYTEKVWGRSARDIPASWGDERLKRPSFASSDSHFLYPAGGPSAFWERMAQEILRLGGEIHYQSPVIKLELGRQIHAVSSEHKTWEAKYVLSTLPLARLCELISADEKTKLPFRSMISVNLVLPRNKMKTPATSLPQWVYINDERVKVARLQFYRAWDESMVPSSEEEIVGLEYFVEENDELWSKDDATLAAMAIAELQKLRLTDEAVCEIFSIHRVAKAYPCYWGDYEKLSQLQRKVDALEGIFSFGRQGLHRYINMDQAMMSALRVVDYIRMAKGEKSRLWDDFSAMHLPE